MNSVAELILKTGRILVNHLLLFTIGFYHNLCIGPLTADISAVASPPQTEEHLRNVKQLTFGGENAEAYFSADGRKLIFQSTRDGRECDQIYTMNVDGSDVKMISNGTGRTTCSYFFPNLSRVLYSSTHLGGTACPPRRIFTRVMWGHLPHLRHFHCSSKLVTDPELKAPGYDAEATM